LLSESQGALPLILRGKLLSRSKRHFGLGREVVATKTGGGFLGEIVEDPSGRPGAAGNELGIKERGGRECG